jgi:hypothetical protein
MTLVEMGCLPRAKQKQQILFFSFFSFSRSLFLLDEGKVVFLLLQMRT